MKDFFKRILPGKWRDYVDENPKLLARYLFGIGGAVLGVSLITYSVLGFIDQNSKDISSAGIVNILTPGSPSSSISTPEIPKVPSQLDGSLVESGKENLHPLAVMIENHPDARPQSGLGQANLVYEAIAEGGITRFMAVFADPTQAIKVGPIRSARTYYVDFATELNAFYAHVGGNIDALDLIRTNGVLDLDQFAIGEPIYQRDLSKNVGLEHTMYSSTEKLWGYATGIKHWSRSADYQPWLFQNDIARENRPAAHKVSVKVSDSLYSVAWDYDPEHNRYLRTMAGVPHRDANTGEQISTKVIILQTVDREPTVTRINEHAWTYHLTGNGSAIIIQNGTATQATWRKSGKERTRYFDQSGQEIKFVSGGLWVHIVHSDSMLTY